MSRRSALVRLAAAYGRHQARRRFRRPAPSSADDVLRIYAADRLDSLVPAERGLLPEMSRCINCGLCAFASGRYGQARVPDLATAYLRDYPVLPSTLSDLSGPEPFFAAAVAACPVGVPLEEVAAAVRRLSHG